MTSPDDYPWIWCVTEDWTPLEDPDADPALCPMHHVRVQNITGAPTNIITCGECTRVVVDCDPPPPTGEGTKQPREDTTP